MMACTKETEILDEEQVNQLLNLFVTKPPKLYKDEPEIVCIMW